jgi:hypothetical protein
MMSFILQTAIFSVGSAIVSFVAMPALAHYAIGVGCGYAIIWVGVKYASN